MPAKIAKAGGRGMLHWSKENTAPTTREAGTGGKTSLSMSMGYLWWHPCSRKCRMIWVGVFGLLWNTNRCNEYSMSCQATKPMTMKNRTLSPLNPVAKALLIDKMTRGIHTNGTTHQRTFVADSNNAERKKRGCPGTGEYTHSLYSEGVNFDNWGITGLLESMQFEGLWAFGWRGSSDCWLWSSFIVPRLSSRRPTQYSAKSRWAASLWTWDAVDSPLNTLEMSLPRCSKSSCRDTWKKRRYRQNIQRDRFVNYYHQWSRLKSTSTSLTLFLPTIRTCLPPGWMKSSGILYTFESRKKYRSWSSPRPQGDMPLSLPSTPMIYL